MRISSVERLKKSIAKISYLKKRITETNTEVKKVSRMLAPYLSRFGVRYQEVPEGKKPIVKVEFTPYGAFFRGIDWLYMEDEELKLMSKVFALSAIMIFPSLQLSESFQETIEKIETKSKKIKTQLLEKKVKANAALKDIEKLEKSLAKLQEELNESKSQMGLIRINTKGHIKNFERVKHKIPYLN